MIQTLQRRTPRPETLLFWSIVVFLAIVALGGGSSRATSMGQVVVRSAATIAAAGWILFARPAADRRLRPAWGFLGLCAIVIGLQLVPLPPAVWSALPGRGAYASAAAVGGASPVWRPLSLAPDLSWSALFALAVPAALLVGLSHLSSRQRAELMLPVAVLIFVSGVLGLAQVTGGSESALRWYGGNPDRSAIGFLANRNHQALLLACALPILAAVGAGTAARGARAAQGRGGQRGSRLNVFGWILPGGGAFIILMLPTTGSRAGLVLGAIAIAIAIAIAAPAGRARLAAMRSHHRRRVIGAGIAAIAMFAAILVFLGRNVAFSRIASLDPLEDFRVRALPVVVRMTREFLPWGSGVGTFDPVFRHFEPDALLKLTYFNQAHNDILQLVLETGIAGALALAAFVIWWAAASWHAWRAPATLQARAARAGSAIVLLCLIASIVDYPLRTPLILSLFTLAAVWMLSPASVRTEAAEGTD